MKTLTTMLNEGSSTPFDDIRHLYFNTFNEMLGRKEDFADCGAFDVTNIIPCHIPLTAVTKALNYGRLKDLPTIIGILFAADDEMWRVVFDDRENSEFPLELFSPSALTVIYKMLQKDWTKMLSR